MLNNETDAENSSTDEIEEENNLTLDKLNSDAKIIINKEEDETDSGDVSENSEEDEKYIEKLNLAKDEFKVISTHIENDTKYNDALDIIDISVSNEENNETKYTLVKEINNKEEKALINHEIVDELLYDLYVQANLHLKNTSKHVIKPIIGLHSIFLLLYQCDFSYVITKLQDSENNNNILYKITILCMTIKESNNDINISLYDKYETLFSIDKFKSFDNQTVQELLNNMKYLKTKDLLTIISLAATSILSLLSNKCNANGDIYMKNFEELIATCRRTILDKRLYHRVDKLATKTK